jgi:ubiquinone/menaquinone biosynthesis C-methylase UbiE
MRENIARFIPSRLKAGLRRVLVSLEYRTGIVVFRRDPLFPPSSLHSVGDGDYAATGEEFFSYFREFTGLKPHERVLDVGCGTGRMARPLTRYLTGGSYDGLDIVAQSIKWCQKTYSSRFPNFHFHFSDIYNKMYNPNGTSLASEYRFPFADSSFDLVFLTSVFTHMLPPDLDNYLSEITRVLKPGGRCLITYFLLNAVSLKSIEENASAISFKDELGGYRVSNLEVPEAAVAFDESRIRELYEKYKMNVSEPIRYGTWCGRKDGLSFQDIVVAGNLVN